MKKITALLLIALLGLSMAACGAAEPAPAKEEAPQQAAEPEKAPEAEPPAAEAPAEEAETAALTGEAPEVGEVLSTEEIIARVVEMQGQPVEELIDWLGEPASRDYASSCNIEGGQDGQLDYGDFTVFTIVWPDGSETVDFCEAN